MSITLPHTFHDNVGETASGVQVMDNLNTLKEAIEALEANPGVAKGQKPTANTARTVGTEYEPSATHAALVQLEVSFGAGAPRIPVSFIVAGGKKWKVTESASEVAQVTIDGVLGPPFGPPSGTGAIHQVFSSYTLL